MPLKKQNNKRPTDRSAKCCKRSTKTSWEPGPVSEWDLWAGWHEDFLKSTRFKPRAKKNMPHAFTAFDLEELPSEVAVVVEECMPYYETLAAKKISPKNNEQC